LFFMASASRDDNFVPAILAEDDTTGGEIKLVAKTGTGALYVHLDSSDVSLTSGPISDGVDSDIKATVLDYTNSNPLAVRLTNTDGDYVAAGAGTQYTEADTDASITGTAVLMEVAGNALAPIQGTVADGLLVNLGSNNDVSITGLVTDADDDSIAISQTLPLVINENYVHAKVADAWVRWEASDDGYAFVRLNGIFTPNGDLAMDDTLNSVVVSGTITATLSDTDNAVLDAIALGYATEGDALGDGVLIQGDDGTDRTNILVDTAGHLQIDIVTAPSIAVTGTFWQATQPVSGTVAVTNADLVTIAGDTTSIQTAIEIIDDTVYVDDADWTDNTSKHLLVGGIYQSAPHTVTDGDVSPFQLDVNGKLIISDGGGAITVDGAVTVDLGANNDVTVTGTVTANLGDGDSAHLSLVADTVATLGTTTYTETTSKGLIIGAVRNDTLATLANTDNEIAPLQVNASGALYVDIPAGGVLESLVDDIETVLGTIDTDTGNMATSLGNLDNSVDGNYLNVNLNVAGTDIAANSGTLNNQTLRVTIATDDEVNNLLGTIDGDTSTLAGAVSGTEIQADIVAALPAGTNAIGKLLPSDIDITGHTNYIRKYYTSAGAATDGIIWSPGAGKRWHITSLYFQTSADATITFEDDKAGGDDPVLKGEYKAGSGAILTFDEKYPFASGEDAADFTVTTSAGNIYVACVGYEI
jgi:hypothetical protein